MNPQSKLQTLRTVSSKPGAKIPHCRHHEPPKLSILYNQQDTKNYL